jgi:hypothetical protein
VLSLRGAIRVGAIFIPPVVLREVAAPQQSSW